MRVILDTNVLLSAIMKRDTPPARLLHAWRQGRFELVSCETQLNEIRDVSRRPQLRERLLASHVGALVNEIRHLALIEEPQDGVVGSPDANDNFLLGLALASQAKYLVTGDKTDLLALQRTASTQIVTARALLNVFEE
jgi:uncharacterized protein